MEKILEIKRVYPCGDIEYEERKVYNAQELIALAMEEVKA